MAPHARLIGLTVLLVVLAGCGVDPTTASESAAGTTPVLPTPAGTLSPAGATALAATRAATTATPATPTVVTTSPAGTATPTPASAAALACTGFVGATFASDPISTSLGLPTGTQLYTFTVSFTPDTYTAISGDVHTEDTYTCEQGTITARRSDMLIGTYDPATDQLLWGTLPYRRLP